MTVFVLRGDRARLQAFADRTFRQPSGGRIAPRVLWPELVLMAVAQIRRGYSADGQAPDVVGDYDKGWQVECDLSFFVPTWVSVEGGAGFPATVVPYIYVDSFAGAVMGREIYGFPKVLGRFDPLVHRPPAYEIHSQVIEPYSPSSPAREGLIASVRTRQERAGRVLEASAPEQVATTLTRAIDEAFGAPFRSIPNPLAVPQIFLKQFRAPDASATHDRADHSSIVRADAAIQRIKRAELLWDDVEILLPRYASVRIAESLGLPENAWFRPVLIGSFDLDFTIPPGRTIWP